MARKHAFVCDECGTMSPIQENEALPMGWAIMVVPSVGAIDLCSHPCAVKSVNKASVTVLRLTDGSLMPLLNPSPPSLSLEQKAAHLALVPRS